MAKHINGVVVFGEFKLMDTFNWTDPTNGQVKPIVSYKVLVEHGDGTRTLESLSFPPNYRGADLKVGAAYGFPCTARINKKQMRINWTLHPDLLPFPAPQLQ